MTRYQIIILFYLSAYVCYGKAGIKQKQRKSIKRIIYVLHIHIYIRIRPWMIDTRKLEIHFFNIEKVCVKTAKPILCENNEEHIISSLLLPFGCLAVWLAGCYCNL